MQNKLQKPVVVMLEQLKGTIDKLIKTALIVVEIMMLNDNNHTKIQANNKTELIIIPKNRHYKTQA